jgi:hypothetical protein
MAGPIGFASSRVLESAVAGASPPTRTLPKELPETASTAKNLLESPSAPASGFLPGDTSQRKRRNTRSSSPQ